MPEAPKDQSTAPAQGNTQADPAKDSTAAPTDQAKPTEGKEAPAATSTEGDAKPADAAKPAATETKPEEKPAVPETYELKLPEGSILDASHLESVSSFAKENGLTQKQAEAILARDSAAASSFVQRQQDEFKTKAQGWVEELKTDKEVGGLEFDKSEKLADRALEKFFPEFAKEAKGAGLKPTHGLPAHLFRGLVRIAKATGDDSLVREGTEAANPTKSTAELFYGKGPASNAS